MSRARKLRALMLDWAKTIHEAIGIESPRAFIAIFALFGLVLFGAIGWLVDRGYRVKMREQVVQAATQVSPPANAPDPPKPRTETKKQAEPKKQVPAITQSAPGGINTVVTGGQPVINNTVINGPTRRTIDDAAAQRIRSAISGFPPQQLQVMFGQSDSETKALGSRLCQVLRLPGWKVECPQIGMYVSMGGPDTGVVVSVKKITPIADALLTVLQKELGVGNVGGQESEGLQDNLIQITVRPQ
jgi:hypothetical protein